MFPDGTNTYVGILTAIAPSVLSWFGLTPTPEFDTGFPEMIAALITLIGAAYAFYGRARHQIPTWFSK